MKHCCRNCHFLANEYVYQTVDDNHEMVHRRILESWTQNDRAAKMPSLDGMVFCHHGVWKSHISSVRPKDLKHTLDQNRYDKCFYWPYQKGMSLEAAAVLQKRESENRQLKMSHRYTQIGLWISAAATFIAASGFIWSIFKG